MIFFARIFVLEPAGVMNAGAFPVPAFPALASAVLFRKSKDSLPGLLIFGFSLEAVPRISQGDFEPS